MRCARLSGPSMAKAWRVYLKEAGDTKPGYTREFGIDYTALVDARFAKDCAAINYPHHKYFIRCATVNGWPERGQLMASTRGEKVRLLAVMRTFPYLDLAVRRPF